LTGLSFCNERVYQGMRKLAMVAEYASIYKLPNVMLTNERGSAFESEGLSALRAALGITVQRVLKRGAHLISPVDQAIGMILREELTCALQFVTASNTPVATEVLEYSDRENSPVILSATDRSIVCAGMELLIALSIILPPINLRSLTLDPKEALKQLSILIADEASKISTEPVHDIMHEVQYWQNCHGTDAALFPNTAVSSMMVNIYAVVPCVLTIITAMQMAAVQLAHETE
jgi:hypothetical protein